MMNIEEHKPAPTGVNLELNCSWAEHQREIISSLEIAPALKGYMKQLVRAAEKSLAAQGVTLERAGASTPESRAAFLNEQNAEWLAEMNIVFPVSKEFEVGEPSCSKQLATA